MDSCKATSTQAVYFTLALLATVVAFANTRPVVELADSVGFLEVLVGTDRGFMAARIRRCFENSFFNFVI